MPSQKGNLKDRLRSWLLFLNYKLKINKRKKEEKKRLRMQKKEIQIKATGKYYSKPKVFGLTIVGVFFGLFEGKEKKQTRSLEDRITVVEQKLSSKGLDNELIKEIESIEQEIFIIKSSKNKTDIKINKCYKKINDIKLEVEKQKQPSTSNQVNLEDKQQELGTLTTQNFTNKEYDNKNLATKNKKTGVYIPVLETKVFNKELKTYNKEINRINKKIKETRNYEELYEYQFLIKQLKLKLNELLNKYDNLKQSPGFEFLEDLVVVKDFDEFNLRKDNKKIKEAISLCENNLKDIESKKQEILDSKSEKIEIQVSKEEAKNEEKSKDKKEVKKVEDKEKNKLVELVLANKIIVDNINKEQRKIMRFNKQVSTMSTKRRKYSIFHYTKNLVSSIVNFGLSLFPISLFKNKMLGGLVSGIMINNSLRSVRKILKPDIKIEYIYTNIEKELISASNCLNKMMHVCEDSLHQIDDIRRTICQNYGNDIIYNDSIVSYLDDLSKIESKILYEQSTILSMDENLKVVSEKNKQKIKIMNLNN